MFDLTGRTGSYFYMAPEVLHNEPYNEKARLALTYCQLSYMAVDCVALISRGHDEDLQEILSVQAMAL